MAILTWVRQGTLDDAAAITHICLLTANQGNSAANLLQHPELPAQVWALPYITLPTAFSFVIIECSPETHSERIVGYIVGTSDSAAYERAAEKTWWPPLRLVYPLDAPGMPYDNHYTTLIHKYDSAPNDILAFSRAHVHINILPEYQGKGWGRTLMDIAVKHLMDAGLNSLYVGSNGEDGKKFYKKLGFKPIRDKWLGLNFTDFSAPRWPCNTKLLHTVLEKKCVERSLKRVDDFSPTVAFVDEKHPSLETGF